MGLESSSGEHLNQTNGPIELVKKDGTFHL